MTNITPAIFEGDDIIPIPGSRNPERVTENANAANIRLTPETLDEIATLAAPGTAIGQTLL